MTFWGPRMDQEPDLYDEPPQEWHECPACDGNGYTVHRVSVYEHGCGFPHNDSEERPCERCNGQGGWIDDKQSDTREPCPYRHFTEEEEAGWERVFADIDENGRPRSTRSTSHTRPDRETSK